MPVVKNVVKSEEAKPEETHHFDIYNTSNLGAYGSNEIHIINEESLLRQQKNEIINNIIKNNEIIDGTIETTIDNTVSPYRSYEETRKRIASQLRQAQQEKIAVDASEIKRKEEEIKQIKMATAEKNRIISTLDVGEEEFNDTEIW